MSGGKGSYFVCPDKSLLGSDFDHAYAGSGSFGEILFFDMSSTVKYKMDRRCFPDFFKAVKIKASRFFKRRNLSIPQGTHILTDRNGESVYTCVVHEFFCLFGICHNLGRNLEIILERSAVLHRLREETSYFAQSGYA